MILIPRNLIMRLCVSAYADAYALVKTSLYRSNAVITRNTSMQSKRALAAG